MSKNSGLDPHVGRTPDGKVNTISAENHMQVFARLARITNMHGTPGTKKGKS